MPEDTGLGGRGGSILDRCLGQVLAVAYTDRATVPLGRWQEKVERYLWYFRSPVFADRYKASKPFRVLTVTTSAERLANMKRVTEEAGGQTWFWFSTYAALGDPDDVLRRPMWFMAGRAEPVEFPYPRHIHT